MSEKNVMLLASLGGLAVAYPAFKSIREDLASLKKLKDSPTEDLKTCDEKPVDSQKAFLQRRADCDLSRAVCFFRFHWIFEISSHQFETS